MKGNINLPKLPVSDNEFNRNYTKNKYEKLNCETT